MDEQMIKETDIQQEHIRLISLSNWTETRNTSRYLDNINILVTNFKNAIFCNHFKACRPCP